MLAPFLALSPLTAVFTPAATPTNNFWGPSTCSRGAGRDLPVPGTPHDRLAPDRLVGLRRRHRPDRGRPRRRLRQGCLRDLARWRCQPQRDQPAGGHLPGRSRDRQVLRLLRPEHGHRCDRAGGHRRELLRDPDRPGQLVRPRLRSGRLLRRPPLAVHLVGRRLRPEQERRLPGRPRRFVPRRLRPVPRRHDRRARLQPHLGPRPSPRAAELPARAVGGWYRFRGPLLRCDVLPAGPDGSPGRLPTGVSNAGLSASNTVGQAALGIDYVGTVAAFTNFGTFDPVTGTGTPGFSGISPSFIFTPPDHDRSRPTSAPSSTPGSAASRTSRSTVRLFLEGIPDRRRGLPPPRWSSRGASSWPIWARALTSRSLPSIPCLDPIRFPVQGGGSVGGGAQRIRAGRPGLHRLAPRRAGAA